MSAATDTKQERINLRLKHSAKKALEHAASLEGITVSNFILASTLARKLPRHPIPAALLGRLAIDRIAQGHGVCSVLLADALKRPLAVFLPLKAI